MGTQSVSSMSEAQLRARALELQKAYETVGVDFTTNPITHNDKSGAIFTFKKDPTTGKIHCTYKYHNETQKEINLYTRATVATSNAGLGYLTPEQLEEYKRNNPNSYVSTEYAAASDAVKEKERLEKLLTHYDSDTRKMARDEYEDIVAEELYASGTVDKKTAQKMAKYARKDAEAGQTAAMTTSYYDKDEYNKAKKELEKDQKAAEKRIKESKKYGMLPSKRDLAIMEEQVLYIDDKDVRKYIDSHKDIFFENGKFSSDKYNSWVKSHLQGDNTLTTGERPEATTVTGLSGKDMKNAAEAAGYDTQKDYTMVINTAKTLAAIVAPAVLAFMTNKNIHDVSELKSVLDAYATNPDPSQYNEFISAISTAESFAEVRANFRNVAVRNAFIGALGPALASLYDPEKQKVKVSDGITASTITTSNVFRGNEVTNIEGAVEIEGTPCADGDDDCKAKIEKTIVQDQKKNEDVVYEKSYFKETKERSHWYDFVNAYNFDSKKYSIKDIYRAIQRRNGYTAEKPNPPANVMLPLELTDTNGNVIATRKEQYQIPRHKIPSGKGNGKGNAPGGKPKVTTIPGSNKYGVFDCDGKLIQSYDDPEKAKAKYKEVTGNDYNGNL